jgi:hypothetical protein
VFGAERGIIDSESREYNAGRNEAKHWGRPPALSSQELHKIIADILRGFLQRRPLTLPVIASFV